MAEPDDLARGLLGLADLIAESVPLETTMLRIAEYCLDVMPHAGGAVVTACADRAPRVSAATSSLVRAAADAEEELREGPGHSALEQRRTVVSSALSVDARWPRYAGRMRGLRLQSVLVSPLILRNTVVAVLHLYAESKDAFTESDALTAQRYAAPAAVIINNAQVLAQCRTEITQLHEALEVRPVIDQAIGIIRSRTGKSAEAALESLRAISNVEHVKVSALAQRIVEDAVRRATGRNGSLP